MKKIQKFRNSKLRYKPLYKVNAAQLLQYGDLEELAPRKLPRGAQAPGSFL